MKILLIFVGIILTFIGYKINSYVFKCMAYDMHDRPFIFDKVSNILIMHLIWVVLLFGGLFCFWRVSHLIVYILIGLFLFLKFLFIVSSKSDNDYY